MSPGMPGRDQVLDVGTGEPQGLTSLEGSGEDSACVQMFSIFLYILYSRLQILEKHFSLCF